MTRSPQDRYALARDEGIAILVTMHGPVAHDQLPLYCHARRRLCAYATAYEGRAARAVRGIGGGGFRSSA
ncbi:MAG: hypothetical protein U0703_24380 [Anaerolineae bacterium]